MKLKEQRQQATAKLMTKLRPIVTAFIDKQLNRIVPSPDTATVELIATKNKAFNVVRKRRDIDHEEALEIIAELKQKIIDIKRHHKFEILKLQNRIDFLEQHPLHYAGQHVNETNYQLLQELRRVKQ